MDVGVPEIGGGLAGLAGLAYLVTRLAEAIRGSTSSATNANEINIGTKDRSSDRGRGDSADVAVTQEMCNRRHDEAREDMLRLEDKLGRLGTKVDSVSGQVGKIASDVAYIRGLTKGKDS